MAGYEYYRKTLNDLENGIAATYPPKDLQAASELSRLFDSCFQQACQAIRHFADPYGDGAPDFISPADYLKTGYEKGLLSDEDGWIDMLEASRRYESYDNPDAFWETAQAAPRFASLLSGLLKTLEER